MASPSFLIRTDHVLILDTSAAINLNATGAAETILGALGGPAQLTSVALDELERASQRHDDVLAISALIDRGLLTIAENRVDAATQFESLVVGPAAATLDDGEAATIAQALVRRAVAVIDERKATRLCAERFPSLRVVDTLDLLTQPGVRRALGTDGLRAAVLGALRRARMSVPTHRQGWVVELIGVAEARSCFSLPARLRVPA